MGVEFSYSGLNFWKLGFITANLELALDLKPGNSDVRHNFQICPSNAASKNALPLRPSILVIVHPPQYRNAKLTVG